jgi:hypothetical protein
VSRIKRKPCVYIAKFLAKIASLKNNAWSIEDVKMAAVNVKNIKNYIPKKQRIPTIYCQLRM